MAEPAPQTEQLPQAPLPADPVDVLVEALRSYLPESEIETVLRAYRFGAAAHKDQLRLSGEPYIHHPLAVAKLLADLHMDAESIVAAILHDVIEDTPTAKNQLAQEFGERVAELVDGVSKLDHLQFDSKAEAVAASFRKMIMAMVKDIRVILIKLADRLHNMRTLGVMPPAKRRRIARETLDIYAPIALRLGINPWRIEMQDLGLKAMHPMRYKILSTHVKRARQNRKELMDKVEITIRALTEDAGIDLARIKAREKTLHSVYNKMKVRRVRYAEIMDLFALRIVTRSVDECYRVLGIVHNAYKPVPGLFKDYVAIPKANGYQSLHTTVFGPHGIPIEVQVRTEDMDRFAESGIAAHWIYKSGNKPSVTEQSRTHQWLQDLLELQQKAGNSVEFLENVKIDLFPDEIYVFTPQGRIVELPQHATVVDFAYAIHTDIGNKCISAKVDRRVVPLSMELDSGQTVEIITHASARPNPGWLNFVVTARARSSIRHYLKNLTYEDSVRLGGRLLNKELEAYNLSLDEVPEMTLQMILNEYGYETKEKMLSDIGLGNRIPKLVARRIAPGEAETSESAERETKPLSIRGTEGLTVSFARCCQPIPGDQIVGLVSPGRGIVIHRRACHNIRDSRKNSENLLDVQWAEKLESTFTTTIRVTVTNSRGVLAQIATIISESGCNIENVSQDERFGGQVRLNFVVSVTDRTMLANIMRRIRNRKAVLRVSRLRG
jgi:GTP diphosphokinase / guanosine-3',5'-bis(diphosphate) 3'-diphosphatase